jgi:hypothetical protein
MQNTVEAMQPADLHALRQLAVRVSRRRHPAAADLEAAKAMAEALSGSSMRFAACAQNASRTRKAVSKDAHGTKVQA